MFGTAANIIKSQHFEVSLKFWFVIERIAYMKTKCVSKCFNFKCVYIAQPVTEISEFLTAYIHKCTVKTKLSYNAS